MFSAAGETLAEDGELVAWPDRFGTWALQVYLQADAATVDPPLHRRVGERFPRQPVDFEFDDDQRAALSHCIETALEMIRQHREET